MKEVLTAKTESSRSAVAEVLTAEVEQHLDVNIGETVIDHPPCSPAGHDARGPQQPERVRHGGVADLDRLGQVVDAELSCFEQGVEQLGPCRVAKQPEQIGELS